MGTCSVRLVFWKAEIQARTSVRLSEHAAIPPARAQRAFYTGRFI